MSAMILDPLPTGVTSVAEVRMHTSSARDDTAPVVTPVALVDGSWTVDLLNVPPGRWWPLVIAVKGGSQYTYPIDYVDLPIDDTLVVSPESVAVKVNIALPLTPERRDIIVESIRDAQADVTGYLGREIVPTAYVEHDRYAYPDGWNLTARGDDPVIRVLSAVPQLDSAGVPTDYFTVTYLAGLDARTDPTLRPIRRYVTAHALNSPEFTRMWRIATSTKGEVRSVSAEGQSISYAAATLGGGGSAGSGAPGALPTLASLDRWRVAGRRVHQGATRTGNWPYTGSLWP